MANIQLAKNLLYLRTLYNLKQDDIANLFNITRQACSNYEKSTRTPDLDVLASFAAYFHVTLDQLILHDLKAEGFTADSDPSSVMMESKTPYMQGIEKNTGNYIYLTEEELNLILAFRSSSDELIISLCLCSQSKSIMNRIHCFFNIFFRNQYCNTDFRC